MSSVNNALVTEPSLDLLHVVALLKEAVAHVCLSVCSPAQGTPAFFAAGLNERRRLKVPGA